MHMPWARSELVGAQVGDARRITSLTTMCENLAQHTGMSFSAAVGSAGRQAAHRIFAHPMITPTHLLAGHVAATAARCREHALVLVAQDTTTWSYASHPCTTALGPTNDADTGWGLFGHSALALTPTGEPLGLLHLDVWARDPAEHGKKHARRRKITAEKESRKWGEAHAAVEAALPDGPTILLIQDREGDVFAFLARPRRPHVHFLLRAYHPRRVLLPAAETAPATPPVSPPTLLAVAAQAPVLATLTVAVSATTGQRQRQAHLTVRACQVELRRPRSVAKEVAAASQVLWVLRATETDPPPGVRPVDWVLLSTSPVPDGETALALVGYYARRWGIERLHYTLKSGLGAERLQFDDGASLQNALAVLYLVAWRLLALTHHARTSPEAPATTLFDPVELTVLARVTRRPVATCREAVRALARCGGWEDYPSAGEPGVLAVWRGLRRLPSLVEGWLLAHEMLSAAAPTYEPG